MDEEKRPLDITSAAAAAAAASDLQVLGDGDLFALQFKIWNARRMFSVKHCAAANIWQFSFLERSGARSVAEASVALPRGEYLELRHGRDIDNYPVVIDTLQVVNEQGELAGAAVTEAPMALWMVCKSRAASQQLGFEKATYYIPAVGCIRECSKGVWLTITRERSADSTWQCAASATWVNA
jgi:hypothetical protein